MFRLLYLPTEYAHTCIQVFSYDLRHISCLVSVLHLSEGFKEAAEKFRLESGLNPGVDLDSLDERIKIRDAIENGKIMEAIAMVNNIHPELLDNNRYLYFHLQVRN